MQSPTYNRRKTFLPVTIIAIVATILLVISYGSSATTLVRLNQLAVSDIHSNVQIQAQDAANTLVDQLHAIASNLDVIASSQAVVSNNQAAAAPLFNAAAQSTSYLTSYYFWVYRNGSLAVLSNGITVDPATYKQLNLTQRPFFTMAEETGKTYYSGIIQSITNSNVSHIFISQPLYSDENAHGSRMKIFNGIVAASVNLITLGNFLQTRLSSQITSTVGLLDPNGVILYLENRTLIGQNVFGPEFQSRLPASLVVPLDAAFRQSLQGTAGVTDISYQGSGGTIAYDPIFVDSTNRSASAQFGVLYIVVPDVLPASYAALIDQQELLSGFIIAGIAGLSVVASLVFIRWNKSLDDIVQKRTSDLVAANAKLAAYARTQTDFVNIAAHELRTPTQAILGNAEILESEIPLLRGNARPSRLSSPESPPDSQVDEKEIEVIVKSVARNARRLKKLTDDILSVARIESGNLQLTKETFDLNVVVREAISEARDLQPSGDSGIESKNIRIFFEPRFPEVKVYADPARIHQVLTNLLANAVKFSIANGNVTVSIEKNEDREIVVQVKDDGAGINPEIMPNLFSKFTTSSPSGTGLGLFISSKIIEAHGGRIWATNNDGGKGSTFGFTLPD